MDPEGQGSGRDSDGLFSDEETGTKNITHCTPNVSKISDNSLNFIGSPLLPILLQTETPGKAVVPKTPLNLVPFITKSNYQWTSDLETPQGEKTIDNSNNTPTDQTESKVLDIDQHTPHSSNRNNMESEDMSRSPIIPSRRVRKRPKRRIFKSSLPAIPVLCQNKDSAKVENLDSDEITMKECISNCDNNAQRNKQINDVDRIVANNAMNRKSDYVGDEISDDINSDSKSVNKIMFKPEQRQENCFMGFATAGGKEIKISSKALSKAEALLSDELENESAKKLPSPTQKKDHPVHPVGFATAGGKEIKISSKALSKAEALLSDELEKESAKKLPSPTQKKDHPVRPVGFATAGGKEIKISSKALSKAEALLSDELENESAKKLPSPTQKKDHQIRPVGFATAGGKEIKISSKALSKAEALLSDEVEKESDKKLPNPIQKKDHQIRPVGFATAGGKEIKISSKALSKAEALLSDEVEKESDEKLPNPIQKKDHQIRPVGFATAGGKEIKISSKALSKAEALHSDELKEESTKKLPNPIQKKDLEIRTMDFATAGGKEIRVSNKTLSKAEVLFSEESETASKDDRVKLSNIRRSKSDLVPSTYKRKYQDFDDFDVPSGTSDKWGLSSLKKARLSRIPQSRKSLSSDAFPTPCTTNKNHQGQVDTEELIASAIALIEDEEIRAKSITSSPDKENCIKTASSEPSSPIMGTQKRITSRKGGKKKIGCRSRLSEQESQATCQTQVKELNAATNEYGDTQMMLDFIEQSADILQKRIQAAKKQDELIEMKRKTRAKPIIGRLLSYKKANSKRRITWRQITGGVPPRSCTNQELISKKISSDVLGITAQTALEYKFYCPDFYGEDIVQHNIDGVDTIDGGRLILDENGYTGITEIKRSFLASSGIDLTLLPQGWIENHYKWIVWKLASMDRMKFNSVTLPRALTPTSVMEQLKYRYDREIDRNERPALRRILEKDDVASRTIVLCVSSISEQKDTEAAGKNSLLSSISTYKVELTDGWYSIPATLDLPMTNYVRSGKIREGTKLITIGAELLNCDQGCSPLEIIGDIRLKIHTNSTRRARWDTKLGYIPNIKCIPISLKNVAPNGGLISKLTVTVVRTYPFLYYEKTATGESIFRNSRCEEKASIAFEQECRLKAEALYALAEEKFSMAKKSSSTNADGAESLEFDWNNDWEQLSEKEFTSKEECERMQQKYEMKRAKFKEKLESKLRESLPPPREVSPLLKVRVIEKESVAIVSVWSPSEEVTNLLKEGNGIVILNAVAAGKRGNELQLTAGRNALFNQHPSQGPSYSKRKCTLLHEIASPIFNPLYSEFDTVGIVSSIVSMPYGMKNFEAVNLASSDGTSSFYLSILFWQGIATFGYTEILTVGSFIACSNIEWRRQPSQRNIPLAYCTERSVFTKNPRQRHLQGAFENLKNIIKVPTRFAAECSVEISRELQKNSPKRIVGSTGNVTVDVRNTTPNSDKQTAHGISQTSRTPEMNDSPLHAVKLSTMKRLKKLQCYGEPPELLPFIVTNSSKRAFLNYQSPVRQNGDKKPYEQET